MSAQPASYGKPCSVCKTVLPLEDFGVKADSADGRKSACRPCSQQQNRISHAARKNGASRSRRSHVPYEKLRDAYLAGASYREIAATYRTSVKHVEGSLRSRAIRRGEWGSILARTERFREAKHSRALQTRRASVDVSLIWGLCEVFMQERGMDKRRFAAHAGVSYPTIRGYANGSTPRIHRLQARKILLAIGERIPSHL